MLKFVELRNLGIASSATPKNKLCEAIVRKMGKLGYYPDYMSVEDYMNYGTLITGG